MELVEKLEVLRVKPGDVLVLRLTERLIPDRLSHLSEAMKDATAKLGVKFVLLDSAIEVVAVQEA